MSATVLAAQVELYHLLKPSSVYLDLTRDRVMHLVQHEPAEAVRLANLALDHSPTYLAELDQNYVNRAWDNEASKERKLEERRLTRLRERLPELALQLLLS